MAMEPESIPPRKFSWVNVSRNLLLAYQSFGVVYGDLSTSPLYVYRSIFVGKLQNHQNPDAIFGAFSLIFWTLTLIPLLKYVLILLSADDNGEGGTFALYSLLCRHAKFSLLPNQQAADEELSSYRYGPSGQNPSSLALKRFLEKHKSSRTALLIVVLLGAGMVIGDGVVTPAISVLSSVSGLQVQATEHMLTQGVVLLIACLILVGLFALQHFGTHRVAFMFAPIVIVWLISIFTIGIYNIIYWNPKIVYALSPTYIIKFFHDTGKDGWISLGGVLLCITGIEAMFADLGHFTASSIRLAFVFVVYPCLVVQYMGQAAFLSKNITAIPDSFYDSIPGSVFWPVFIIATLAAIVASQGIITATFSIIKQCHALGCFPRVKIVHTSKHIYGQIYIPEINWILMILTLAIAIGFQDTTEIGNAYGLACMTVVFITTFLMALVIIFVWQSSVLLAVPFLLFFWLIEGAYLSAAFIKVPQGGWVSLVLAFIFMLVMFIWHYGTRKKYNFDLHNKVSLKWLLGLGPSLGIVRVPGIGLIYSELATGVPAIFSHFVTNLPAFHNVLVFVCVKSVPVPYVSAEERFLIGRVCPRPYRMYRCIVRYGYKDIQRDDGSFENQLIQSIAEFIQMEAVEPQSSTSENSSFDGRMAVISSRATSIQSLQEGDSDGINSIQSSKSSTLQSLRSAYEDENPQSRRRRVMFQLPQTTHVGMDPSVREELLDLVQANEATLPPLNPENCKDIADPNGQGRRLPAPLTPRSQQNFKARLCLPPLQPLAIARRSLDEWPKAGSDDIGEWPLPCTPSGRESNNGGERLKLDLSNIASNPDMNGGGCKREKIAFFDKKCSKVAEHIYLGGDAVARDRDILKQHAITHILNCVGFVCPEYFKAEFVYRTLWLQDSPSEDITSILYDVFDYFEDVREQGGRVFVHCCQGVSRSTSLVIAYRMWREGQSFDDAFQYVKAARGIADPNMGFACQLLQCQKRVHAIPLSPTSLLRMYRLAPHSPYDPLHLVPKMLNQPSPAALDSRGAFIVNIPCSIYVWIGRKCESIMERDARGAVCQIVRYEKVQGPIEMIWEGEEPSYFWAAFANLLPLMDKSSNKSDDVESSIKICPGERKAESYNVDFEIFQKAIVGGIVPPFASSDTEQETRLPARESSWSILRRKFASGIMKEFLSGSKLAPSRVYPDSLLIVGVNNSMTKSLQSSANHLSSSSSSISLLSSSSYSSLSSSPSYLSPDSISSDSSISSKCLSDSPSGSPSTVPYSDPLTSTSVSFSNMSLLSSKMSPQSISKTSKFIDVNFASKSCSQSTLALSIAERRGSLSKCLTLPKKLTDHSWEEDSPSRYFASELDESRNIEVTLGAEGDVFADQERTSSGQAANNDSCHEKPVFDQAPDNPHEDHASISDEACILNKVVDGCSVYRWPSLEKLVAFRAGDLDSKSIFIFMSSVSGEIEKRILYIWVGRSFNHDSLEGIDIDKVGSNILTQIGLPEDTKIQIVNEDEEPAEFVLVLESL